jgi:hypothetical protein
LRATAGSRLGWKSSPDRGTIGHTRLAASLPRQPLTTSAKFDGNVNIRTQFPDSVRHKSENVNLSAVIDAYDDCPAILIVIARKQGSSSSESLQDKIDSLAGITVCKSAILDA